MQNENNIKKSIGLVPVIYRDHKTEAEVLEFFHGNKDFRVQDHFSKFNGVTCSKSDLIEQGFEKVKICYKRMTEFVNISLVGEPEVEEEPVLKIVETKRVVRRTVNTFTDGDFSWDFDDMGAMGAD